MRVILVLVLFFATCGAFDPFFLPEEGDFLLTYPRSGTNWTVGIINALLKRPVRYIDLPDSFNVTRLNRLGVEIDESLPDVYRSHMFIPREKQMEQSRFRLIVTLRNYKECIVKDCQFDALTFVEALERWQGRVTRYFDILTFFDSSWKDPSTRHLIVYEDIISNPRKCAEELLLFLGGDLDRVPEFFENYDEWNEKMLASYHAQHANRGPPSNNQPIFHSKDFPKELLRRLDEIVEARYPELWEKYLCRYKEEE